MISTNRDLPLHDEASGVKNVEAWQGNRGLAAVDAAVTLAIGMVLGALMVGGLLLAVVK